MSYDSLEQSTMESQPIELYHFHDENGNNWRYTSHISAQTLSLQDYLPQPIDRESIEITSNHFKNEIQVTLNRNNLFALNYVSGILESKVLLDVYRMQLTDFVLYWSGVVQRVVFDENEIPTIRATPVTNEVVRVGARRRCQIMCDLPLYGTFCSVDSFSFRMVGVIASVSGVTLGSTTFSSEVNGWLTGGMIVIGDAKRLIQWHVGTSIKISRQIVDLADGANFIAYAGCAHTAAVCSSKFSNKVNYGGCEFLPLTNPLKSAIVY